MNHDEENPDLQALIEPELEARLVAWVLGEASAFEAAEMERQVAEKPELAIFKRRIEAVHGLVGLAVRPEKEPLRLASERRAKILETIGAAPGAGPMGVEPDAPAVLEPAATRRKQQKVRWIWTLGIAAGFAFGAILTVFVAPSLRVYKRLGPMGADRGLAELRSRVEPVALPKVQVMPPDEQNFLKKRAVEQAIVQKGAEAKPNQEQITLSPFEVAPKPSVLATLRQALTPQTPPGPGFTVLGPMSAPEGSRLASGQIAPATAAPAAQIPEAEKMVPLQVDYPKPLFAGTPRPIQVKNLEPASVRAARRDTASVSASDGTISAAPGMPGAPAPAGTPRAQAPGTMNLIAGGSGGGSIGGTAQRESSFSADQFGLANGKLEMPALLPRNEGKNFEFGGTASLGATGGIVLNAPPGGPTSGWNANANGRIAGAFFDTPQAQNKSDARDKKSADGVITLSPFTVASAKDPGFYAGNTLAGTRLDSNLGALGNSSIDATKQLAENGALAINGISLVEADKEGARKVADLDGLNRAFSAAAVDDRLSKEKASAKPEAQRTPPPDSTRVEISTATEPVSTFSLHVSDVSFRLAQAALARGEMPDPERIRAEEFYNAFDYGDPMPTTAEKIACRIEQAAHPMLQQRNLVRIAMRVPATGRGAGQPLRLTVLLDTSGSMEREDRVASVRRALEVLATLLGPNDRVTLIGFAQQPRLLADELPGDQAAQLADIAAHTPYTGGTNLEEALKLAGELARRHQVLAAQNRIVLITDGAANLGNADPAQLAAVIESFRRQGIAFDACGVGTDGLDDAILEALTRKGDGRYYVLDKPEDADAGFARQLAGAFRPAAENVKVQVRFNPARVGRYRLIGFEQHRLREEDFRNDQVDAAELAAEEAAVALYQVEVLPQGDGELGEVFVRFRDAATGNMVERSWTMLHDPNARAFDRSTPTMQLAGTAALLAEKLRGGEMAGLVDLAALAPVVNALRGHFANDGRVQELATMFEQLRRMSAK